LQIFTTNKNSHEKQQGVLRVTVGPPAFRNENTGLPWAKVSLLLFFVFFFLLTFMIAFSVDTVIFGCRDEFNPC